jgi:hypothetical protein
MAGNIVYGIGGRKLPETWLPLHLEKILVAKSMTRYGRVSDLCARWAIEVLVAERGHWLLALVY